jgi:ABC-type multidrug transport system fused ATPase/permease subunit
MSEMKADLLRDYQALADRYQSVSNKKKDQLRLISVARLMSFMGIIPAFYYLSPINEILAFSVSFLFLASFLFLIKKFNQTEKRLLFDHRLIEINRAEIKALNHDFSAFDPGNEFTDHRHEYSFDLDLFGSRSLFQFLNRTVTAQGKRRLATMLNQSFRTKEEIKAKQDAVQDLAEKPDWRQHFMAIGRNAEEITEPAVADLFSKETIELKHEKTTRYLPLIFPLLLSICTALFLTNLLTGQIFLIAFLTQLVIYLFYARTIPRFNALFQSQGKTWRRLASLLRHIETLDTRSGYLQSIKEKLWEKDKPASKITSELQQTLDQFDYRQNLFVAFILNFILLWDIRCVAKLYRWQQKYAARLPDWLDAIAETDALVSLANCNFNHPDWMIPEVIVSDFHFEAEDLGHPLIPEERCVRNPFRIATGENIVIITGANMAGKSTFLRTIGVNMVLASSGCKVCATTFRFSPVRLFTNMRTTDNLMKNESYFYAELLRLQWMLRLDIPAILPPLVR